MDTSVEPPPAWAVYWCVRDHRWLVETVSIAARNVSGEYLKVRPLNGDCFLINEDDVFSDLQDAQRYATFLALRDT